MKSLPKVWVLDQYHSQGRGGGGKPAWDGKTSLSKSGIVSRIPPEGIWMGGGGGGRGRWTGAIGSTLSTIQLINLLRHLSISVHHRMSCPCSCPFVTVTGRTAFLVCLRECMLVVTVWILENCANVENTRHRYNFNVKLLLLSHYPFLKSFCYLPPFLLIV